MSVRTTTADGGAEFRGPAVSPDRESKVMPVQDEGSASASAAALPAPRSADLEIALLVVRTCRWATASANCSPAVTLGWYLRVVPFETPVLYPEGPSS